MMKSILLYIHTAAEAAYPEFHFAADYSGPGISNPSTFGADANTHWTLQKVRGYGEMCKNLIQMMSNNRDAETTFYTVKSENGEAVLVGYVDRAKDLILLRQI